MVVMLNFFDLSTTAKRFRFVAVLEAFTWLGLLIGMAFKYIPADGNEIGVKILAGSWQDLAKILPGFWHALARRHARCPKHAPPSARALPAARALPVATSIANHTQIHRT